MASFSRMMSSYRKFRVYNKYSHPLSLLFLDLLLLSAKAVAILCLALVLYNLGSGLFGNSRNTLLEPGALSPGKLELHQHDSQMTVSKAADQQRSVSQSMALIIKSEQSQRSGSMFGAVSVFNPGLGSAPTAGAEPGHRFSATSSSDEPKYGVTSLNGGLPGSVVSEGEAEADRYSVIDMAPVAGQLWLQQQQPDSYTVQYGTSTRVALLEELTSNFPNESDTIIFQFANANNRQEPVFGIVHGIYSTAADARKAIDAMPAQLLRYDPWVRRIDQIKEVSGTPGR